MLVPLVLLAAFSIPDIPRWAPDLTEHGGRAMPPATLTGFAVYACYIKTHVSVSLPSPAMHLGIRKPSV
eukprot:923447-Amphidinium_carterae.1